MEEQEEIYGFEEMWKTTLSPQAGRNVAIPAKEWKRKEEDNIQSGSIATINKIGRSKESLIEEEFTRRSNRVLEQKIERNLILKDIEQLNDIYLRKIQKEREEIKQAIDKGEKGTKLKNWYHKFKTYKKTVEQEEKKQTESEELEDTINEKQEQVNKRRQAQTEETQVTAENSEEGETEEYRKEEIEEGYTKDFIWTTITVKENKKPWKEYLRKKDITAALKPCCVKLKKLTQQEIKKYRVTTMKGRTVRRRGSIKEEEFEEITAYKRKYTKHWRKVKKEGVKRWNKRRLNLLFKQLEEEEEGEQNKGTATEEAKDTSQHNSEEKKEKEEITQRPNGIDRQATTRKDEIEEMLKMLGEGEEAEDKPINVQSETTQRDGGKIVEEVQAQRERERENLRAQEAKEIGMRMEHNRNRWTKWIKNKNKKGKKEKKDKRVKSECTSAK